MYGCTAMPPKLAEERRKEEISKVAASVAVLQHRIKRAKSLADAPTVCSLRTQIGTLRSRLCRLRTLDASRARERQAASRRRKARAASSPGRAVTTSGQQPRTAGAQDEIDPLLFGRFTTEVKKGLALWGGSVSQDVYNIK